MSLQMRKAALSIAANIAEGFRRRGKADKVLFPNPDKPEPKKGFAHMERIQPGTRPQLSAVSNQLQILHEKARLCLNHGELNADC